jgi:hypothetical protein
VDDVLLAAAFDLAAGRAEEAEAVPPPALVLFARRVVAAGRRVAALPACPPGVFARAQALADERPAPRRAAASLLALLFDSWAAAAPALRGGRAPRFLRFRGPGGALDVEVVPEAGGGARLRGTVDVSGGRPLAVVVKDARGRSVRARVQAGGVFEASIPAADRPFTLSVTEGRSVVLRTGPVPPPSRP